LLYPEKRQGSRHVRCILLFPSRGKRKRGVEQKLLNVLCYLCMGSACSLAYNGWMAKMLNPVETLNGAALARIPLRTKPVAALLAVIRLLRDPQDTRQVFLLTQALRGKSARRAFEQFAASEMGAKILNERRSLLGVLTDHASLAALPEGSLGRIYLAFMAAESLSAKGLEKLADEHLNLPETPDGRIAIYAAWMRDMHDLYHVLTGYGRDELGEVCVLAFSYPQQKIASFKVISTIGALHIGHVFRKTGRDASGVLPTVREASRHGKEAVWLPGEDLVAMLSEDLETLRRRLNIQPPARYQAMARA
jgi:ubiquinone biosynthesis protein COQ4